MYLFQEHLDLLMDEGSYNYADDGKVVVERKVQRLDRSDSNTEDVDNSNVEGREEECESSRKQEKGSLIEISVKQRRKSHCQSWRGTIPSVSMQKS